MTSGQKGNALPLDTGVKSHQKIAIFTANQQRNTELKNKQSNPNVKIHSTSFNCNLSKKRPTKCPCSRAKYDTTPIVHRDIRSFTFHLPNTSHHRSETISLPQDNRCILPPPQQNRF